MFFMTLLEREDLSQPCPEPDLIHENVDHLFIRFGFIKFKVMSPFGAIISSDRIPNTKSPF